MNVPDDDFNSIQAEPVPIKLANKSVQQLVETYDEEDQFGLNKCGGRRKYGKMKVIYDGICLLTLGPDYLCFIPALTMFCLASYAMISLVNATTTNWIFLAINYTVCIGQCLSYLLVGLSNPGIVINTVDLHNLEKEKKKSCGACGFMVPKNSRHCHDCDVCIKDYDHHCPWTSKCIGGGNLYRFYLFLGWTPFFFIYCMIAFVACLGNNLSQMQRHQ